MTKDTQMSENKCKHCGKLIPEDFPHLECLENWPKTDRGKPREFMLTVFDGMVLGGGDKSTRGIYKLFGGMPKDQCEEIQVREIKYGDMERLEKALIVATECLERWADEGIVTAKEALARIREIREGKE